jgi:glycine cleavage system H protein
MESFTYVDMFATKGIEYIVVISFLLILVPFWIALNKPVLKSRKSKKALAAIRSWFSFHEDHYYHQGHSWALPIGDNIFRVGMDDFAQKLVGEPESIDLPEVGDSLTQGDKGWHLNSDSKSVDMLSPVNGTVVRINEDILTEPGLVNKSPYEQGWLLEIRVPKAKKEMNNLLSGNLAKNWMSDTVAALRLKMGGELGLVMQDGGIPVSGFAKSLSSDNWDDVAAEFLRTK